jgi:hypothetical protein
MRRFLLPATALVLVVTACGAGVKPAPRLAEAGARLPSVHALLVQRKRAALGEARSLLRTVALPPGARPYHRNNANFGTPAPLGEHVDAHRVWWVRRSFGAVLAFIRTHDPPGFRSEGATYGTDYRIRTLARGRIRYLDETVEALRDATVVRVDAKVVWVYPRSRRERVPARTSRIVVTTPASSTSVTDPAKVARIVRWFGALPVAQAGNVVVCPAEFAQDMTALTFRSPGGAWLAEARVPPSRASICDAIVFQIGGKAMRPLVDRHPGDSFLRRLRGVLGHPNG